MEIEVHKERGLQHHMFLLLHESTPPATEGKGSETKNDDPIKEAKVTERLVQGRDVSHILAIF